MTFIQKLVGRSSEPVPELHLSEDEIRPAPLSGPQLEAVLDATDRYIDQLETRRDEIQMELSRLSNELTLTNLVLQSQLSARAVLAPDGSPAARPKMPKAATLIDPTRAPNDEARPCHGERT